MKTKIIAWTIGGLTAITSALALNQTFINNTLQTSETYWTQTVMNPSILGQTWIMPIVWTIIGILIITRDWEKIKEMAFPVTVIMGTIGFHVNEIQYIITAISFVISAISTETLGILWQKVEKQAERIQYVREARSYKKQTGTYAGFKDYQKIQKAEKQLVGRDTLTNLYNQRADQEVVNAIARESKNGAVKLSPKKVKEIEAQAKARAKLPFRHVFEGGEKGVLIRDTMDLSHQRKQAQNQAIRAIMSDSKKTKAEQMRAVRKIMADSAKIKKEQADKVITGIKMADILGRERQASFSSGISQADKMARDRQGLFSMGIEKADKLARERMGEFKKSIDYGHKKGLDRQRTYRIFSEIDDVRRNRRKYKTAKRISQEFFGKP